MHFSEWLADGINTLVGVLIGWFVASFLKASKSELRQVAEDNDKRHKEFSEEMKLFVTKTELREALNDLRADQRTQFEIVRQDLARIQAALMDR